MRAVKALIPLADPPAHPDNLIRVIFAGIFNGIHLTFKVLNFTTAVGNILIPFFIPGHTIVAGYYGFTLDVRVSVCLPVRILFPDDNLSKHQWIFPKLGMCIDIVEIWFWIANGQILSNFDGYLPETRPYLRFSRG